ncbi:signal peptidase I [Metabacillus herbersteinensis]|uniref:Signal peptidase I n=1 Tax=Metabacillus herbersteinensis TaxID=283816 RepID=A0ABV6GAQ3_9BACI
MAKTETTKSKVFDWTKSILLAVGLAIIIRVFLFEPYLVEGSSMDPTLKDGDRLFVNKTLKLFGDVERGDIVIVDGDEEDIRYVKRVIGEPGDLVEAKQGQVFVNGEKIDEPYLNSNFDKAENMGTPLTNDFEPVEVPIGELFVMGDNRLNSMDSRNGLGLIDQERILGKTEFVFFPFGDIRKTD